MWFVLLYFSYWSEFLLVGLSFIILALLTGTLNQNRASGVHDTNPQRQPHQTFVALLLREVSCLYLRQTSITLLHPLPSHIIPQSHSLNSGLTTLLAFSRHVRFCSPPQISTTSHKNIEPCWFHCQKDYPFFNAFQNFYPQTSLTIHTPH